MEHLGTVANALPASWRGSILRGMAPRDLALAAAGVLSVTPLLVIFFERLWRNEHYQFFPALLAAFAWFTYRRWPEERAPLRRRDRWLGLSALAAGSATLVAAVVLWSPWFAAVGAWLIGLAFLIHFGGGDALDELLSAWLLLWLLLPLPAQLDRELVLWVQGASSRVASAWLDVLGYNHALTGHVLHVAGKHLLVDEACSGIHSFFVMLSLTAVLVVAFRYPRVPAALLMISSLGWAVLGNAARIAAMAALYVSYGLDLSSGTGHTALGLAVFVTTLGMLYSTDRMLLFALAPAGFQRATEEPGNVAVAEDEPPQPAKPGMPGAAPAESPAATQGPRPLIGKWPAMIATCLFLLVALAQAVPFLYQREYENEQLNLARSVGDRIERTAIRSLPEGWSLVHFERHHRDRAQGAVSAVWDFRRGDVLARASLDFPFLGWHELSQCYMGQGWEIGQRTALPVPTGAALPAVPPSPDSPEALQFDMQSPTGEFGHVLVSLFDLRGCRLAPPRATRFWDNARDAIVARLTRRGLELEELRPAYQLQVFVYRPAPLTADERQRIEQLFFVVLGQLVPQLAVPHGNSLPAGT